jgi:hypothetical protein
VTVPSEHSGAGTNSSHLSELLVETTQSKNGAEVTSTLETKKVKRHRERRKDVEGDEEFGSRQK